MTNPEFDLTPSQPEARNPVGFFIVAAIVGFLVLLQLLGYLYGRKGFDQAQTRLRAAVQTESVSDASRDAAKLVLSNLKDELEPYIAKDSEAAAIYAATSRELKEPVSPVAIATLANSSKPEEKLLSKLYGEKPLIPSEIENIPSDPFVYRLARIHAKEKFGIPGARAGLGTGLMMKVMVGVIAVVDLTGLGLWIYYLSARSKGYYRPLGHPLGWLSLPGADRAATRSSQFFGVFLAVQFLGLALSGLIPKEYADVPMYAAMVAGFLLLSRTPVHGKLLTLADLGIRKENLSRHVLIGLLAVCALEPLVHIAILFGTTAFKFLPPPHHPATDRLQQGVTVVYALKLFITAAIIAPFTEELMFRATLFPALATVTKSPVWGAVLSSLAFAMIHPTGIPAWPALATIGCFSCFLAYQTKSLVPSIVLHGVHNAITLLLAISSGQ